MAVITIPNLSTFVDILGVGLRANTATEGQLTIAKQAIQYLDTVQANAPVISSDRTTITVTQGSADTQYIGTVVLKGTKLTLDGTVPDTFSLTSISFSIKNNTSVIATASIGLAINFSEGFLTKLGVTNFALQVGQMSVSNTGGVSVDSLLETLTMSVKFSCNLPSGSGDVATSFNNLSFSGSLKVDLASGALSGSFNSLSISNGNLNSSGVFVPTNEPNSTFSVSRLDLDFSNIIDYSNSNNSNEFLSKIFNGATDTVNTYVSVDLPAGIEIANCLGYDNIDIVGNNQSNQITGNAGNNRIDGMGGADTMVGLAGDDIYIVDNASDIVIEATSRGTDAVVSSISYKLPDHVENLSLSNSKLAISATGNKHNNIITGNDRANVIIGAGGADTMDGGDGSDLYIIASPAEHPAGELLTDTGNTGTDIIRFSSVVANSTLFIDSTYSGIEKIEVGTGLGLLPTNPTAKVKVNVNASTYTSNGLVISGNYGDNLITGTNFADRISGSRGGDTLIGGGGADTLDGGAGNDLLLGGDGLDILLAGLGNDTLTGGSGADTFRFSTKLGKTNIDTITDFTSSTDRIELDDAIFKVFTAGSGISSGNLVKGENGVVATELDDYLIFNTSTGALFYDADGSDRGAMVQIATLTGVSSEPVSTDFWVV